MIVRELLTRIGWQVGPDWKQVPRDIDNVKKKAEDAGAAFRGIFAGFLGFSALKSIVNTADEMQSLQFRIGELPQTITTAAKAFDTVAAHAIDARQSVAEYAKLYVRVGGATKNFLSGQEEVLQVTDAISKALVVGGASALEQKSAIEQLSQGFQAGKFQGNDFKIAMAALSTDIREKLAKAMGFTAENLKDMSSQGKLTAEAVARAFIKIGPDVAYSFRKVPLTIGQAFTIIQGKYGVFVNRINRESMAVTAVATFFVSSFETMEGAINDLIDALGGGSQALKIFGLAALAAFGPSAVKLLVGGLQLLTSQTFLLFAALFVVILAVQDFYTWLGGGDSVIGRWVGSVRKANGELDKMKLAIIGITTAFAAFILLAPAAAIRTLWMWVPYLTIRLFELAGALWAGNLAALGFTWPLWLVVAAILAVIAAGVLLYKYLNGDFDEALKGSSDKVVAFAKKFLEAVDWMINKWNDFKSIFHMPDLTVAGSLVPGLGAAQNIYKSLVPSSTQQTTPAANVTITQNLSPGTTPEIADRANSGIKDAIDDFFGVSHITRQMNQVSQ